MTGGTVTVQTRAQRELVDITASVAELVAGLPAPSGLLCLFNPHTTAGLTVNEGADPAVARDMIKALEHLVPLHLHYHHLEGNSPAHLMASMAGSSLTIFFTGHRLLLGTWQAIFFCEFDGPRTRTVEWKVIFDPPESIIPAPNGGRDGG